MDRNVVGSCDEFEDLAPSDLEPVDGVLEDEPPHVLGCGMDVEVGLGRVLLVEEERRGVLDRPMGPEAAGTRAPARTRG